MSERVEQVIRCSHDGRTMARVVIREGSRFLDVVGGRDGHGASLISELEGEIASWRSDDAAAAGMAGAVLVALRRALAEARAGSISVAQESLPLPSELDVLAERAGRRPLPRTVVCPRCHRVTRLAVRLEADGRCAVVV